MQMLRRVDHPTKGQESAGTGGVLCHYLSCVINIGEGVVVHLHGYTLKQAT